MSSFVRIAAVLGLLPLGLGGVTAPHDGPTSPALFCAADPEPSDYYAIDLVTTKNVPGTAFTRGQADVTYAAASPFGISIAADGSYAYVIRVDLSDAATPPRGGYVAWATTTEVDEFQRLGALDDTGRVSGRVEWNKFLVVITVEDDPATAAPRWSGPIAFRGMSRSGKMHTMAGHGPFQIENCATYGFSN